LKKKNKFKVFSGFFSLEMSSNLPYQTRNACDTTIHAVETTLKNFGKLEQQKKYPHFLLGWDGFIDLLYNMVKNRTSPTDAVFYDSMAEFGQKIVETAGSSASIERVLKKKIGGGFSVNTARAIGNMMPRATLEVIGALGYPDIDPLFPNSLPQNVALNSVSEMGVTLAMEFNDGKIMSQDMEGILTLDYNRLVGRIGGKENLISSFERANAIGNGHWSLNPHMTNFWERFITDIFPSVSDLSKKIFFVDPADIGKRSTEDVRHALFTLKKVNEFIPVLLSVNDREAIDIARVLSREGIEPIEKHNFASYEMAGQKINEVLNLSYFIIHEPHFATISGKNNDQTFHHWITEGYTTTPRFTTAAGDHFNGGAVMSLLAGLTPTEALVVANAATAIFVRTGRSPTLKALHQFIESYFNYIEEDKVDFCFPD
jgi:hypothetical protein